MEQYGSKHGYNFQHAINGGEYRILAYSVDGYDLETKTVFEYYEYAHNKLSRKKKDEARQRNIMKHPDCNRFIIMREWTDEVEVCECE